MSAARNVTSIVLRAGLRDLSRNRWIALFAAGLFVVTQGLFWFGGTGPQVMLSLLNIMLLVVPLVSLVFGTMHVYGSREFVELLLAQPVPRGRLFTGLYLGLALPLAAAFLAGAVAPFALHLGAGATAGGVLMLAFSGVALTFAFTAIATWLALVAEDRLKGVGASLGIWLAATVIYDGIVLAVAASFAAYPLEKPMLGFMLANPVDLARVLVLTRLDSSALMGYTGALFQHSFGTLLGAVIGMSALALWCAGPLVLASRKFRVRDF
ncbi:MAG TPA: ABC transporter permease subunit [Gemmatimonadaceae bacterium]|nr:ABC transporter permease subunit [Gemmatimonadaceae bacterium]